LPNPAGPWERILQRRGAEDLNEAANLSP
jgi:hypothetical protein